MVARKIEDFDPCKNVNKTIQIMPQSLCKLDFKIPNCS